VLALVDYPQLIDHPSSPAIFPPDAIARAREILTSEPGGTGSKVHQRSHHRQRNISFSFFANIGCLRVLDTWPFFRAHLMPVLFAGAYSQSQGIAIARR
jgi:hypothetical protein